jgi:hypothetical protein
MREISYNEAHNTIGDEGINARVYNPVTGRVEWMPRETAVAIQNHLYDQYQEQERYKAYKRKEIKEEKERIAKTNNKIDSLINYLDFLENEKLSKNINDFVEVLKETFKFPLYEDEKNAYVPFGKEYKDCLYINLEKDRNVNKTHHTWITRYNLRLAIVSARSWSDIRHIINLEDIQSLVEDFPGDLAFTLTLNNDLNNKIDIKNYIPMSDFFKI